MKVARPSLTWVAYNLFRLIALALTGWALVAQFIALASDMSAYSSDPTTAVATSAATAEGASDPTLSSSSSLSFTVQGSIGVLGTATASSPFRIGVPTGTTLAASTLITAVSAAATPSTAGLVGTEMLGGRARHLRRRMTRSGDAGTEMENTYIPGSAVPDQPGGVVFAVFARLLIAAALGLTGLAQAGWPEMFLYERLPWLGPQSTPLFLGGLQVILGTENLRVYAKQTVLMPAWAIFAVGLVNIHLGLILLYLARRMPKSPAPSLYFNLSTRLLLHTRPPAFYAQLFRRPSQAAQADVENPNIHPGVDGEKRKLPPSNAHAIGLEESDNEEYENRDWVEAPPTADPVEKARSPSPPQQPRTRPSAGLRAEQDVTRSGYPTFSGGGMADPRRQVPTGVVERANDGRALRFVRDDGGGVGRTGVELAKMGDGRADSGAAGDEHPSKGRKAKLRRKNSPPQLDIGGPATNAPLEARNQGGRPPGQNARADDGQLQDQRVPSRSIDVISRGKKGRGAAQGDLAPSADAAPPSTITMLQQAHDRQSSIVAASELATHFPVPPGRITAAPLSTKASIRESTVDLAMRRQLDVGIANATARGPLSPSRIVASPRVMTFPRPPQRKASLEKDKERKKGTGKSADTHTSEPIKAEVTKPSSPSTPEKSPRTPSKSPLTAEEQVATVVRLPTAQSRSLPNRPAASITGLAQKTEVSTLTRELETALSHTRPAPELVESVGSRPAVVRRSSLKSNSAKPARGVRFDLSAVTEESEPDSPPSPDSPPKTGLRIPGTNFHLPLPFAASRPGTPSGRRASTGSVSSVASTVTSVEDERCGGLASVRSEGEGLAKRPELVARESSDLVGLRKGGETGRGQKGAQTKNRPSSAFVLGG